MSKLKIMQQGGGLSYSPFVPEMQGTTVTSSTKSSSSDGESKIDALDKELIALMKSEDLLPSDISFITNQVVKFQKRASNLSAIGDYSSAMPGMLQIIGAVKKAKYFKDQSDTAAIQMAKENAGGEFALDSRGLMYVLNKETGKLDKVDVDKFDSEKYSALSNSELLFYRQTSLPNDTVIFNDIQNAVGIGSVIKEIDRIIKEYGTSENVQYLTKDKAAQQVLLDANSPDGIYKLSTKKPSGDMRTAWLSIYRQLAPNMQHLLNVRAKTSGMNIPEYISDIVLRNINTKIDANYDSTVSKAAGFDVDPNKTTKEAAEQLTQNNYLMQIGTKRLVKSKAMIVPAAAQVSDTGALMVDVYNAGMPVDKNMKGIGMMTLSHFRTEAEASKAGDFSSVTFGNKVLRPEEYDAIVYDGNSELNIAMLPYTYSPTTGQITPNMALFTAFNYVQQILANNPNISQTELRQKAAEKGFTLEELGYDYRTNTMSLKDTMPFITFSAFASQDAINIPKTMRPFLEKLSNKQGKSIMQKYKILVNYGQLNPSKNDRRLNNFNDAERWDFYKGNVYIPMSNAARALLLSGIGEYVPKSSMTDYAARVMARQEEVEAARVAQNDPAYDTIANLGQFR